MIVKELGHGGGRTDRTLVFETGDDVMPLLEAHARDSGIGAAHFTALGAFRSATLAYFEWSTKEYEEIPVDEQVEVTALIGDIGIHDGDPVIHAHCVLGRRDGTAITGHLLQARVRPTLELFLTIHDTELTRTMDDDSGLPLIGADKQEGT